MAIIELKEVCKEFGGHLAINRVSFSVAEGESFALLGPNGAGKTTLIKILSTLLKPTSGEIIISGLDLQEEPEEVKKLIGVVSHNPFLYDELTARENLHFYADLFEVNRNNAEALLKMVNLEDRGNELVGTFSRGMKQRLAIARALIHAPKILLLDEPTAGLDIQGKHIFYKWIKELSLQDTTILLTTHYLDEAEKLCDKACILDGGEVKACGTLEEIKGVETLEETFIRLTEKGVE